MNNEAEKLAQAHRRWQALQRQAPQIVGRTARAMFKESFKRQGSIGHGGQTLPWAGRGASPSNRKGRALLRKSGRLMRSIQFTAAGKRIVVSSNEPYAQLQNDGGTVKITAKMRRFFWAQFYNAGGNNGGKPTPDAQFWRSMALHKGSTMDIPARPFIYDSRELVTRLNREFKTRINQIFKP